jgi:hypothetical protein
MLNSKLSKVLSGVIPVALSLLAFTSNPAFSEESAQSSSGTGQQTSNPKIALGGNTEKPVVENPKASSDTEYTTKQNRDLKKALSTYVGDMVISAY